MIERAIEHWLTNTNERGYEIPYCQVLISQGHKVMHMSSHGGTEQGKDIITLNKSNRPCAFQLKTGRIDKEVLRTLHGELTELVTMPIRFPGIPQSKHYAYFVTNGELNDIAMNDIDALNEGFKKNGYPIVQVITKGQLLQEFIEAQGKFLPTDIPDFHRFLELLLHDGKDMLPKNQIALLIESILMAEYKRPKTALPRAISSSLLLTGYALGNQYTSNNHVAIMEAWVLMASYIMGVSEKYQLPLKSYQEPLNLSMLGMKSALEMLRKESIDQNSFVEEYQLLYDGIVYRTRITMVLGFLSAAAIGRKIAGESNWVDKELDDLIEGYLPYIQICGESALPFVYMIARYCGSRIRPLLDESLVLSALDGILSANAPHAKGKGIPDPYHSMEECLRLSVGLVDEERTENHNCMSYTLPSLVEFLASRIWRQALRMRWKSISKIQFEEFIPDQPWELFRWHNNTGSVTVRFPQKKQSWSELRQVYKEIDDTKLPLGVKTFPELLPVFLCVYPHRFTLNMSRYLNSLL